MKDGYSRPRDRRKALQDVLGEVFGGEVAILEESTRLDFNVTDRAQFLNKGSEGVKGTDRLTGKLGLINDSHQDVLT